MTTEHQLNFTKAKLLGLPAPSTGRVTYHDTKTPGLQLRVTATGVKTFSVFRRVKGGSPVRMTIGRFPEISIERARQQAMSHVSELANGSDVAEQQRKARAIGKFADLFAEYMKRHSKVKKRTWQEDDSKYKQYLDGPLGKKRLSEITRKHIADIHSKITTDGHPVTANRVHALVSSVFGWAISVDLWESNPAVGVRKNAERSRDRFIQGVELPHFFIALNSEPNDLIRDFFLISLLTGARRSNVLEMTWDDINLDGGEWRIPRTKNGDPQTVSLASEAIKILRRRQNDSASAFVFPGSGESGHLVEPKKGWRRILVKMAGLRLLAILAEGLDWDTAILDQATSDFLANSDPDAALQALNARAQKEKLSIPSRLLPDIRIHDLRRTLASWQVMTGATLSVVGKTLNHRSPATTSIYARLDLNPVHAAVQRATDEMYKVGGVTYPDKLPSRVV